MEQFGHRVMEGFREMESLDGEHEGALTRCVEEIGRASCRSGSYTPEKKGRQKGNWRERLKGSRKEGDFAESACRERP